MKKIVLLGDSIRMGYDKYVKMALDGVAEVYYPKDNCRFTQYVLRYIHAWVEESGFGEDTDLVHWNVGLWDVAQVLGDEPITPIEVYEALFVATTLILWVRLSEKTRFMRLLSKMLSIFLPSALISIFSFLIPTPFAFVKLIVTCPGEVSSNPISV